MTPEAFDRIQQAHAAGGAQAAFEQLIGLLRAERDYGTLFDALLLRRRYELGLPLLWPQGFSSIDPATRKKYEAAYVAVCREVGELYLASSDLVQAWRYFRAIGEPQKVRDALEGVADDENMEALIAIAYGEGVNPRKGFELILKNYGVCRAITSYEQFPGEAEGKAACGALLVRQLYQEVVDNMRHRIEGQEGTPPDTDRVAQLLQGRDWLLEDSYLVDVSHLAAVARFSVELEDPELLRLAAELADYGRRIPDTGYYAAGMPVQEHLQDCSLYLHALLGENLDEAVAYFRRKVAERPQTADSGPAQLLVYLLVRLGRMEEALDAALEYLADVPADTLRLCPSITQLLQMSKNPQRLLDFARERSDLLTFTAGLVADPRPPEPRP